MLRLYRACISFVSLILIGVLAVFALVLIHTPVFGQGEGYELYAGASSSAQILPVSDPVLAKFFTGEVAGESVRYAGDRAEELIGRFRAKLLFTEECCGAVNYYLFSPMLGGGVKLMGETVNLHIAVREGRTAVGTPLIFGGV